MRKYFSIVDRMAVAASVYVLAISIAVCSALPAQGAEFTMPKPEWQKKAAAYSAAHEGVSMLILIDGKTAL